MTATEAAALHAVICVVGADSTFINVGDSSLD